MPIHVVLMQSCCAALHELLCLRETCNTVRITLVKQMSSYIHWHHLFHYAMNNHYVPHDERPY